MHSKNILVSMKQTLFLIYFCHYILPLHKHLLLFSYYNSHCNFYLSLNLIIFVMYFVTSKYYFISQINTFFSVCLQSFHFTFIRNSRTALLSPSKTSISKMNKFRGRTNNIFKISTCICTHYIIHMCIHAHTFLKLNSFISGSIILIMFSFLIQ